MITDSVSKESYLLPTMQHACALIGAALLVVCVSGGWLKYLSFQGAVTAGVVGAGLVSVAIENQRRGQVIEAKAALAKRIQEAKPPVDPIDTFRGVPKTVTRQFEGIRSRGLPGFRGQEAFFIADGENYTSNFYINDKPIKGGWEFSLGDSNSVVLRRKEKTMRNEVVLYPQKGEGTILLEEPEQRHFSGLAYDEANQRLYVYEDNRRIIHSYEIIDNRAQYKEGIKAPARIYQMAVDKAGRLYAFYRRSENNEYRYYVLYEGKSHLLPPEFNPDRMKVVEGKIYYSIGGEMFVRDLATEEPMPIALPVRSHIMCFDVREDLIVYVTSDFYNNGIVFNLKTGAHVSLKGQMGHIRVQFCDKDTIASFGPDVGTGYSTLGKRADWLIFNTPVGSTSERRP